MVVSKHNKGSVSDHDNLRRGPLHSCLLFILVHMRKKSEKKKSGAFGGNTSVYNVSTYVHTYVYQVVIPGVRKQLAIRPFAIHFVGISSIFVALLNYGLFGGGVKSLGWWWFGRFSGCWSRAEDDNISEDYKSHIPGKSENVRRHHSYDWYEAQKESMPSNGWMTVMVWWSASQSRWTSHVSFKMRPRTSQGGRWLTDWMTDWLQNKRVQKCVICVLPKQHSPPKDT